MVTVLYGITAYRLWLGAQWRSDVPKHTPSLTDARPSQRAIADLKATLPLRPPYHLLAAGSTRHATDEVVLHVTAREPQRGELLPARLGIYAVAPEPCILQIARRCSGPLLAKAIMALCGTGVIDPQRPEGIGRREPLTTCSAIGRYARRHSRLAGSRATLEALALAADRVRSPAEADLFLRLTLPHRHGGAHLPPPIPNDRIALNARGRHLAGRVDLEVDLHWRGQRLIVEYDSRLTHLTSEQHTRDIARRAALEASGYRVVTVTASHLYGTQGMEGLERELARALGRRIQPRGARYVQRRAELRQLPRGFDLPDSLFA